MAETILVGPIMYAVATAAALVNLTVGLGIIGLLALIYLVLPNKTSR